MKKALIGVPALYDEHYESTWMIPKYTKAIEEAGGIAVILPLSKDKEVLKQSLLRLDGLMLAGGNDVNSALYNEEAHEKAGKASDIRDFVEAYLLEEAIELDIPVFAICRGLQLLNVVLGGSLYQDLASQFDTTINHRNKPAEFPYVHDIKIVENTLLSSLLNKEKIKINSFHHQAIKYLAKDLQVCAIAEDNIIEAVSMPTKKFILAVQWHPEYAFEFDSDNLALFRAFVAACE